MDVYALIYVTSSSCSKGEKVFFKQPGSWVLSARLRVSLPEPRMAFAFYRPPFIWGSDFSTFTYCAGHEYLSLDSNEYSRNSSSKLQHLAWHPAENLIACGSGNSLFLYHA
ncbi:hypothetical protein Patl1_18070 [Pistacia atlantica]|uniref:Uncharacterized protein n=1 Tax=Pistacia atlantica TaxID=434234 RepID=A0ACC1BZL3_9ROSI|nr:hypothetical protein Patl1_18070 [Pistacia atlantica]